MSLFILQVRSILSYKLFVENKLSRPERRLWNVSFEDSNKEFLTSFLLWCSLGWQ